MSVMLLLGIFWTLYGIAGLMGIQRIPPAYRGKRWARKYARTCGVGWLMIGIPWIILYLLCSYYEVRWSATALFMVLVSLPSILYSTYIEKLYQTHFSKERR